MTATREQAIQHTIDTYFGKRSLGNISYGTIRKRLDELDGETVIDRNRVAVLLEESPQKLTKLEKHNPPKSPFKPGKTPTTTVAEALKWHDQLIAKKLTDPRTGNKWADNDTSIPRRKTKLPVNYKHVGGNTIIYGIVLSEAEVLTVLQGRGMIKWMTVRAAIEHPHWEHAQDRVLWALAFAEYESHQLDVLVSDAQHGILKERAKQASSP